MCHSLFVCGADCRDCFNRPWQCCWMCILQPFFSLQYTFSHESLPKTNLFFVVSKCRCSIHLKFVVSSQANKRQAGCHCNVIEKTCDFFLVWFDLPSLISVWVVSYCFRRKLSRAAPRRCERQTPQSDTVCTFRIRSYPFNTEVKNRQQERT